MVRGHSLLTIKRDVPLDVIRATNQWTKYTKIW